VDRPTPDIDCNKEFKVVVNQCLFKKVFAGTKKIIAGTNTREISEMTLFLVI